MEMGSLAGHNSNDPEGPPKGRRWYPTTWKAILAIFLIACCLLIIGGVIVLSIIPLYLSQKGTDQSTTTTNLERTIKMAFATNYASSATLPITNLHSLSQQINERMGYQSNIIAVQSAALNAAGKRRKRDTSSGISCNMTNNGSITGTSDSSAMSILIIVNRCPKGQCGTDHCITNCLNQIKSKFTSVFGSNTVLLTIQTADGQVLSISCTLCLFDDVIAPTCTDGIKNGKETDQDCGGKTCILQGKICGSGQNCINGTDCTSGVCTRGVCQAPKCNDGVQNGGETGRDCGGPCAPTKACDDGSACVAATDCKTGWCNKNKICKAPTCVDGEQNQGETGVDCGGSCAPTKACDDGSACVAATDCKTGWCNKNKICKAPTCSDSEQNQGETGVDCGGSCAPSKACDDGSACVAATDCKTGWCNKNQICKAPTCVDGEQNQGETGVDCGGPCVNKQTCVNGLTCAKGLDCVSRFCVKNICQVCTLSFEMSNPITVDTDPRSLAVGDLNNDQHLDIAVGHKGSLTVKIFLGNGAGSFTLKSTISFSSNVFSIAAGQLNQDNNMDIVVATDPTNFTPSSVVYYIKIVDINNDQRQDIVYGSIFDSNMYVLFGQSGGSLQMQPTISLSSSIRITVITVDFDGDGNIDIVALANGLNQLLLLRGNGAGTFSQSVLASYSDIPVTFAVGHFNDDNLLDIVVEGQQQNFTDILLQNTNGNFTSTINRAVGRGQLYVLGDFNNDKQDDIAVLYYDGGRRITVRLGYGDGTLAPDVDTMAPLSTYYSGMTTGDFNEDSLLDIVVTNPEHSSISILINKLSCLK
ncbi:unnamed protein product [Adineta ricciae]|uniref:Uncharacterized protein n=1 Tax=Adineta ricciae TaxID=249248 RepID=A0A816AYZ1_ADIRI|nr:unnamed protein product [Adineta ricciae]